MKKILILLFVILCSTFLIASGRGAPHRPNPLAPANPLNEFSASDSILVHHPVVRESNFSHTDEFVDDLPQYQNISDILTIARHPLPQVIRCEAAGGEEYEDGIRQQAPLLGNPLVDIPVYGGDSSQRSVGLPVLPQDEAVGRVVDGDPSQYSRGIPVLMPFDQQDEARDRNHSVAVHQPRFNWRQKALMGTSLILYGVGCGIAGYLLRGAPDNSHLSTFTPEPTPTYIDYTKEALVVCCKFVQNAYADGWSHDSSREPDCTSHNFTKDLKCHP